MDLPVDKKILGFDMDGVIIDHSKLKVFIAQRKGTSILPKDTPYEIIKNKISSDILREIQFGIYGDPELSYRPVLMKGVKQVLSEIKKRKIRFYLISRRKNSKIAVSLLSKKKLWPKYFNESNAFFVAEPEDKNIKAAMLGINYYFDDEIEVLRCLNSVPNRYLFDQFGVFEDKFFYNRVGNWKEVAKVIFS